ncbi:MAG: hypothetical protein M5R36_24000 [Deltaproteobacteria bacterium]|nr:hypothetical protein [Deltaproteobacteria bacterium]
MSRNSIYFPALLLAMILIAAGFAACGGGESGADGEGGARVGDDDDDGPLPPGDDDAGDDDVDDDDADDDTGDDDTSGDDDADDDTGDDDDDTAGDAGPVITIAKPSDGSTYNAHEIPVEAAVENADWGTVRCFYDAVDITSILTIANEAEGKGYNFDITGQIDGVVSGWHDFKVLATNAEGTTQEISSFLVQMDDPYLELTLSKYLAEPEQQVTATVTAYDEDGGEVTVSYQYTVQPNSGFTRNGDKFTFHDTGTYQITAQATLGGDVISDTETIVIKDLTPTRVAVVLTATQTQAGVPIAANATVYNSHDEPLDGFQVVYTVSPQAGVTVDGQIITMTKAVQHTITGTVQGTTIKDSKNCTVTPGDPAKIVLTVIPATIPAGGSVLWTGRVEDLFGNQITPATITVTVTPNDGVTINGNTITFTKALLQPYQVKGRYQILTETKTVQVNDVVEPRITWTQPERGSVTLTTGVEVRGFVTEEDSGIASFTINDNNVNLTPEGLFIHTVTDLEPGINIIIGEAIDLFGNESRANISVLRGQLAPDDTAVEDAVAVRVNQRGLDQIEDFAETFIADFDIMDLLGDYVPFEIGEPGDSLYILGDLTQVAFDPPQVQLTPQWYGLNLSATIPNIDIDGYVDVTLNTASTTRYTLEATGVITAGADIHVAVVDGDIVVTVENFALNLDGLTVSIDGYSNPGLIALIRLVIDQAIGDLLSTELPQMIEDLLGSLDLAFDQTIGDATYLFTLGFADLSFDVDGMMLLLDALVTTDTIDPDTRDLGGSLHTPNLEPQMGIYTPDGGLDYGFGAALGDDFLNQALYQFYRSGLLTFRINEEWADEQGFQYDLTTTDLALFLPGLADLYPDAPIEFWLDPQLPPVIVFGADDAAADGLGLKLQLGDMLINMVVVPDGLDPVNALGIAASAEIALTVAVNPDTQSIAIGFGSPQVYVDVFESEFIYFPYALVEQLIPLIVELALPLLGDFIEEIPIPSFEGADVDRRRNVRVRTERRLPRHLRRPVASHAAVTAARPRRIASGADIRYELNKGRRTRRGRTTTVPVS